MTNEAANIVASELLGESRSFIEIGSNVIPVYSLTMKEITKVFRYGALIDVQKAVEASKVNEFGAICEVVPYIAKMRKGIAEAVVRDKWFRIFKVWRMTRLLKQCDSKQLHKNWQVVIDRAGAKDLFQCAALMSGAAQMIARPKETKQ